MPAIVTGHWELELGTRINDAALNAKFKINFIFVAIVVVVVLITTVLLS